MSHEQSETIQDPETGGWVNIYGRKTGKKGRLPGTPTYPSVWEAEAAAGQRSLGGDVPNWNDSFGDAPAAPGAVDLTAQAPLGGFDMAMQETPPEVAQMMVPAASPAEVANRQTRWQKIAHQFQSNPNLQRAMLLTAAQLAQPVQPGQTHVGAAANAAVVGMNAYQVGQQQEAKQAAGLRGEAREDKRLGLEQERLEEQKRTGVVSRKATEAGTESTLLDAELKKETKADTVRRGQALAEKAVLEVTDFRDAAGFRKAERALKEQEARIKTSIPDEVLQQAELDKVNKARMDLDKVKAEGRKVVAEASILEQDLALGSEGRAKLKSTTQPTAEQAKWKLLADAYDGSEKMRRLHPDKNAWMIDMATKVKENPAQELKYISEAIDATDVKDPLRPELEKLRREAVMKFGGSAGASTPPPSPEVAREAGKARTFGAAGQPKKITTKAEFDAFMSDPAIKSGTVFIAPDGSRRKKP